MSSLRDSAFFFISQRHAQSTAHTINFLLHFLFLFVIIIYNDLVMLSWTLHGSSFTMKGPTDTKSKKKCIYSYKIICLFIFRFLDLGYVLKLAIKIMCTYPQWSQTKKGQNRPTLGNNVLVLYYIRVDHRYCSIWII